MKPIVIFLALTLFIFSSNCYGDDCEIQANQTMKMLLTGKNSSSQIINTIEICENAAKAGDLQAQYHLSGLYPFINASEGKKKALFWMRKAAENGHKIAQYNLAQKYENGDGVEQNYGVARNWYIKSAEQNYIPAQQTLGFNCIKGIGQPVDFVKGISWYELAAENGSEKSMRFLINVYSKGAKGFPANNDKVKYWQTKLDSLRQ